MKTYDLIGERFGRLLVTRQLESDGKNKRWECQCDCGNTIVCVTGQLRDKTKGRKSCGCIQRERIAAAKLKPKVKQAPPPKMVFNGETPCLLQTEWTKPTRKVISHANQFA